MSFKGKRLWSPITVRSHVVQALVDTGAGASVLPRKLLRGETIVDEWNIITPLGSRMEPIVAPAGVELNGQKLDGTKFVASKTRFPIIGNNILFAHGGLLLGRDGIKFGPRVDNARPLASVNAIVTYGESDLSHSVERVAVSLLIDGVPQKAFIDTGLRTVMAATASAPLPSGSAAKGFDLKFNALGQFKPATYYKRSAKIMIGEKEMEFPYRQFSSDRFGTEPFVIGGGILEFFDLHIDAHSKVVSFFESGEAFRD